MTPLAAMSLTKPMFPLSVTPLLTVNSNECVRCRQSMSPAATTPPANSSGADSAEAAGAIIGSLELVSRQCDTANGHMMQPQGIYGTSTRHIHQGLQSHHQLQSHLLPCLCSRPLSEHKQRQYIYRVILSANCCVICMVTYCCC